MSCNGLEGQNFTTNYFTCKDNVNVTNCRFQSMSNTAITLSAISLSVLVHDSSFFSITSTNTGGCFNGNAPTTVDFTRATAFRCRSTGSGSFMYVYNSNDVNVTGTDVQACPFSYINANDIYSYNTIKQLRLSFCNCSDSLIYANDNSWGSCFQFLESGTMNTVSSFKGLFAKNNSVNYFFQLEYKNKFTPAWDCWIVVSNTFGRTVGYCSHIQTETPQVTRAYIFGNSQNPSFSGIIIANSYVQKWNPSYSNLLVNCTILIEVQTPTWYNDCIQYDSSVNLSGAGSISLIIMAIIITIILTVLASVSILVQWTYDKRVGGGKDSRFQDFD